jgi:hypothetical protein
MKEIPLKPVDLGLIERRLFYDAVRDINEHLIYALTHNQESVIIDNGSKYSNATIAYALAEFTDQDWVLTARRIPGDKNLRLEIEPGQLASVLSTIRPDKEGLDDNYTYLTIGEPDDKDNNYLVMDDTDPNNVTYLIIK